MRDALQEFGYYRKDGHRPVLSRVRPISFLEDGDHSRETATSQRLVEHVRKTA